MEMTLTKYEQQEKEKTFNKEQKEKLYKKFSSRLKSLTEQYNTNLNKLADFLGVSYWTVNKLISNTAPFAQDTIVDICVFFKIDLDYFVRSEEEEKVFNTLRYNRYSAKAKKLEDIAKNLPPKAAPQSLYELFKPQQEQEVETKKESEENQALIVNHEQPIKELKVVKGNSKNSSKATLVLSEDTFDTLTKLAAIDKKLAKIYLKEVINRF